MELINAAIDEIPGADAELVAALGEAALPVDDLAIPGRNFFRFHENGRPIGFVGWERVSDNGALLRSLVVVPGERGKGKGRAMAEWMLRRLSDLGIEEVWMLTTTADQLGARLGFVRVDHDSAPDGIRHTRQFADLCPSSSVLMYKKLGST